jgi:chaperone BCS1
MSQSDMSTSLVPAQSVTVANSSSGIYDEPLDTPGVIPQHLKRKATFEYPLIEIAQRLFMRMKPEGTMFVSNLEAILAIIALYKAAAPVYEHLKKFVLWGFTSHVTVADYGKSG